MRRRALLFAVLAVLLLTAAKCPMSGAAKTGKAAAPGLDNAAATAQHMVDEHTSGLSDSQRDMVVEASCLAVDLYQGYQQYTQAEAVREALALYPSASSDSVTGLTEDLVLAASDPLEELGDAAESVCNAV